MQLHYKKIGDNGSSLLILHGLLGSLDNWHSIAKQLSDKHQVYIIDQRNHGSSPHDDAIDYEILAQDIVDFCAQHQINKTNVLGHSMGGKVAMLLALLHPQLIDKLIVADIAPTYYDGGHETILFAMAEAPLKSAQKREEVELFLQPRIQEFSVRQFILKNLTRDVEGKFIWKCNFEALIKNYRKLMDFPIIPASFLGETYFLKGEKSNYINQDNWDACDSYFPNNKMYEIKNAGHWLHADNPTQFVEKVSEILN